MIGVFYETEKVDNTALENPIKIRAWQPENWADFSSMIRSRNFDLSNLTSSIDTTRAIESLTTTIRGAIEVSVPTVELKTKFAKWWTQNLTILSARAKRARKGMRKQYSPETQVGYKMAKRK
jgi:hypothetical protein